MNQKTKNELISKAKEAREKAYVPYSGFPIGAAVLTTGGKIFTGSNIENAAYGLTNCAERTAIFKAISEGYKKFEAILIITDTDKPVTPCGSCRQVFTEFGDDIEVISTNYKGDELSYTSGELLPGAFDKDQMEGKGVNKNEI